ELALALFLRLLELALALLLLLAEQLLLLLEFALALFLLLLELALTLLLLLAEQLLLLLEFALALLVQLLPPLVAPGIPLLPAGGRAGGRQAAERRRTRQGGERGMRVEAGQTVPREVDQVGGDLLAFGLTYVQPPLTGQRDHADEHLGVHRRELRVVAPLAELVGQHVLHLAGDLADQAGEGARAGGGVRIADQDAEALAALLDVLQQSQGGALQLGQ